jgi:hypothetical protein
VSRRELVAGILLFFAVAGAFGTIQLKGVSITLPWQVALAATLIVAIVLIGMASVHGSTKVPPLHSNLVANVGYGRQKVTLLHKSLVVEVRGSRALRRDGDFRWTLLVENRSKRPVPVLLVPLIGEVSLREGQLGVSVRLNGGTPSRARVLLDDANSPTVHVPFGMPGLAPGARAAVEVAYRWPGIVSCPNDRWVLDLSNVERGGSVEVTLCFPTGEYQRGRVEVVKERVGLRWVRQLGAAESTDDGRKLIVRLSHIRASRSERHLYLYTYDADMEPELTGLG